MCLQSVIDDTELENIQTIGALAKEQVATGQYTVASYTDITLLDLVKEYSNGIDFYNFLVFHAPQDLSSDKRTLLAMGGATGMATMAMAIALLGLLWP